MMWALARAHHARHFDGYFDFWQAKMTISDHFSSFGTILDHFGQALFQMGNFKILAEALDVRHFIYLYT